MKKGIHPENYRTVVFKDMSNDYAFLSRSTANTKETIKWEDGNEYPLIKIEVSSKSHPFYTGKAQFVDTAGRIDKFRQKYGKFQKDGSAQEEAVVAEPVVEETVEEVVPEAEAVVEDTPAEEVEAVVEETAEAEVTAEADESEAPSEEAPAEEENKEESVE